MHRASLAAYDARPGGREALGDRLDVMLREQRYAAERQGWVLGSWASATRHDEPAADNKPARPQTALNGGRNMIDSSG